ncbi:hypothetical protein SESBI_19468 [Sesbania bispinosa]|nr:hypothetical protein SESBI_19468 [Sesbania bispinosa]
MVKDNGPHTKPISSLDVETTDKYTPYGDLEKGTIAHDRETTLELATPEKWEQLCRGRGPPSSRGRNHDEVKGARLKVAAT